MLGNSSITKYSCYDCDQINKKHVCIFTQFVGYERIFFYPLASVVNWLGDGMDPVQEVPWPLYLHELRNGSVSFMLMRSTVDLFGLYVLASITRLSAKWCKWITLGQALMQTSVSGVTEEKPLCNPRCWSRSSLCRGEMCHLGFPFHSLKILLNAGMHHNENLKAWFLYGSLQCILEPK